MDCLRTVVALRCRGWRLGVLVAVLSALVLVGCDEPLATVPSRTVAAQLSGTWHLVSQQMAGEAEQQAPDDARYTLSFADGRMMTFADCNTCVGEVILSGSTVTVGPVLACTRAACPTQAFASGYIALLSGDHAIRRLTSNTLEMSSVRGTLRFTR